MEEKKESWIETLIELLNEYSEWWHWRDENFDSNKLLVISKKYWFIKWLVDNDKIDRNNRDLLDKCMEEFDRYPITFDTCKVSNDATDMLLMLLSISDNPIEFLISILK